MSNEPEETIPAAPAPADGPDELLDVPAGDRDLPEISATDRCLPRISEAAWSALEQSNTRSPRLFRQGARLVRLQHENQDVSLVELTKHRLRYALGRAAYWFRLREGAQFDALPPLFVVDDMLAHPAPLLPELDRITSVPVFGPMGDLVTVAGYHSASGIYYAPASGFSMPEVASAPTPGDIQVARTLLVKELLGDFPFTSDAELAHTLAAALLPFVRSLVHGSTPLHLIEKPSPGTGAGLLSYVICFPALGRGPTVMTLGQSEDETRRTLTAKLAELPSVILIDNVHMLESAALSAAITTPGVWTDRLIGSSNIARYPVRCLWLATGNNPSLSTEIARRVVRVRLDAKVARPEERVDFRHPDLADWVRQEHGRLVWALLTLVQAWIAAGRPPGSVPLGSFESWATVIGGILEVAGIPGFLENRADLYAQSDVEGGTWEQLFARWWEKFAANPVGVAQVWPLVWGNAPLALPLGTKGPQSQKTRVGLLLRDRRGQQFGDYRLEPGVPKKGAQQWRLEHVPAQGVVADAA